MKVKFIASLFVLLTIFSCKKETKSIGTEVKKEEVSNNFKVTLDAKVKKDDSFHVYYTEDGSTNFTEESSVWFEFKGSDESQKIVFNLPDNTIPTQLRLDFGVNKDQEDIIINSFKMEYQGKVYEVPGTQFFTLFVNNPESCTIDSAKATIKPINNKERYLGPFFYPIDILKKEIEKLVK